MFKFAAGALKLTPLCVRTRNEIMFYGDYVIDLVQRVAKERRQHSPQLNHKHLLGNVGKALFKMYVTRHKKPIAPAVGVSVILDYYILHTEGPVSFVKCLQWSPTL